jgi:Fe-S-cluster containining protein
MDRSEKRRQLAQDRAGLARGVDVMARDGRQVAALMRVLHDLVRISMSKNSVSPLIEFVHANMTASMNRFRDAKVACGRGCYYCCHIWVDTSAPELLYLAKGLSGRRRAMALEAVKAAVGKTGGMSTEERARFVYPCPMLVDNACSVYKTRPLACRALGALDAKLCERAFVGLSDEDIFIPLPYMFAGSDYRLALDGAMRRAGLNYQPVELNSGLAIALTRSTAEPEWLTGGNPFADADRSSLKDPFENPDKRSIYEAAFG